jgi:hypothetical protein
LSIGDFNVLVLAVNNAFSGQVVTKNFAKAQTRFKKPGVRDSTLVVDVCGGGIPKSTVVHHTKPKPTAVTFGLASSSGA